ncbi:uncharacterized protein LOC118805754 isoform X2 [Colossoma macropomum]|uniref:uncharacterized protein LOC118805754 isoform X2 n=1 Tax=Colossoma macropomum TaxID=42526 RepID=UPI0018654944|nr:uncharacterized protein LOC118805754 isoform X2 [Colossoma macropomum]
MALASLEPLFTMSLILQLSLFLISTGFTAANESNEPSLDLECLNDYDTEMVCRLSSEKLNNCPEYKLNISLMTIDEVFTCSFVHVIPNFCECKFQIQGFVLESFEANLWRGEKTLLFKEIDIGKSIKPKRPTIVSVMLTENGNFRITWDTNYTSPLQKPFSDSLSTELTYGVKGGEVNVISLEKGRTEYEIVGRNLQPNSDYVVMARVSTDYNQNSRFSDYSQPYEFETPIFIRDILKILIPILCVSLIIFISTLFYCYIKIIKQWWDKIPIPKIAPIFEKPVPHLSSFGSDFSPVYLETSKLAPFKDKMWISTAQVGVSCEDSLQSLGKSGNSSQVIYAQTVSEDAEDNVNGIEAQCELLEEYKSANRVQSNRANIDIQRESGNSSGSSFSNKCYLGSDSSGSSFLNQSITHTAYPSNESENSFSALSKNLDPVIPTDFDYGPCNGCSVSVDSTQFMPLSTETVVVPGYQSVNELLDHGNKPEDQAFISYHNDINLIMAKTIPKNPQSVPSPADDNMIIPVDDSYQSFPSLDQNTWSTELEQNIAQAVAQTACHNMSCVSQQVLAPSLKGPCGPVLNISPGIQIDCSYQRV